MKKCRRAGGIAYGGVPIVFLSSSYIVLPVGFEPTFPIACQSIGSYLTAARETFMGPVNCTEK